MLNHGSFYTIARKLQLLYDLLIEKIKDNLHKAHLRNEKSYNMRSIKVKFIPGQEVYRLSFQQSDFKNNFNAVCTK